MALVRMYCGLASADPARSMPAGSTLTAAIVDEAGRLLDVCEISDDPAGYARLGRLLVERAGGFSGTAIATDSDDGALFSLLSAAGHPLAVVDDDSADDFAERFGDDESAREMQSGSDARRAVGLARALQLGALSTAVLSASRNAAGQQPLLAAHSALLNGRHAAAAALREVLRQLYPAALQAYPDPTDVVPLAVLAAVPEPGQFGKGRRGSTASADAVAADLTADGVADAATINTAITALRVAVSESPRRGTDGRASAEAVAETVRQAVAAVRAYDAGCEALVATLLTRVTAPVVPAAGRVSTSGTAASDAEPASPADTSPSRVKRRSSQPAASGGRPVTSPPVAPPPVAPAPAAALPGPPATSQPALPAAAANAPTPSQPTRRPEPPANRPASAPPSATQAVPPQRGALPPAEAGEPFRATLTTAALNSARAELQRRAAAGSRPEPTDDESPSKRFSATDHSVPVPPPRPAEPAPPGSRANWPLVNSSDDDEARTGQEPSFALGDRSPAGLDLPAEPSSSGSRITPPWLADDLPPEPPMLRLVEPPPLADRALRNVQPPADDRLGNSPSLRLVDSAAPTLEESFPVRDTERFTPPGDDEGDGDLLIFAAARSAWFSGQPDDSGVEWGSVADSGWQAAEQAARPAVGDATNAGLPKRVPKANLVPGSALRDERPLRIVRDPARLAQHTTGYFQGWRRGQEIGGFAVGGRPGRESAGGWDFSRDDATDESHEYEYRSARY